MNYPSDKKGETKMRFSIDQKVLEKVLNYVATKPYKEVAAQTGLTLSAITCTGARLGDYVLVSSSANISEMTVTAYVSAANTVTVRLFNGNTSTAIDLPSSTWRVMTLAYD